MGKICLYGHAMTTRPKADTADRFLTVAEVAADLRISPDTVRRWIAAGKLPAVRVSARDLRIERAEYDQLLAELRTSSPLVAPVTAPVVTA